MYIQVFDNICRVAEAESLYSGSCSSSTVDMTEAVYCQCRPDGTSSCGLNKDKAMCEPRGRGTS